MHPHHFMKKKVFQRIFLYLNLMKKKNVVRLKKKNFYHCKKIGYKIDDDAVLLYIKYSSSYQSSFSTNNNIKHSLTLFLFLYKITFDIRRNYNGYQKSIYSNNIPYIFLYASFYQKQNLYTYIFIFY